MENFVKDPDCALMEIDVSKFIYVRGFEVVKDIELG